MIVSLVCDLSKYWWRNIQGYVLTNSKAQHSTTNQECHYFDILYVFKVLGVDIGNK